MESVLSAFYFIKCPRPKIFMIDINLLLPLNGIAVLPLTFFPMCVLEEVSLGQSRNNE